MSEQKAPSVEHLVVGAHGRQDDKKLDIFRRTDPQVRLQEKEQQNNTRRKIKEEKRRFDGGGARCRREGRCHRRIKAESLYTANKPIQAITNNETCCTMKIKN